MAKLEFVFQAATDKTHAESIRALLNRLNVEKVLISVGFVREAGVEAVEEAIERVATRTRLFVGIRNDITTVQAIRRLLKLKVQLYAVDTGSRRTIFHPKLYMVCGDRAVGLIVGSANLTFQGLHNNIEASTLATLDLDDEHDREFVKKTLAAFDQLLEDHPRHVFLIKNKSHAEELFQSGRLADETIIPAPTATTGLRDGGRDTLPPMKLKHVARPQIGAKGKTPGKTSVTSVPIPIPSVRKTEYYLVWKSNELSKRDLNLPSGGNTNRTGSMGLKKGAMENIDHRHFFRDEIFGDLNWTPEANRPYSELAQASVQLVIKNLNYGTYELWLRHDTRTTTRSYEQHNEMTHLRWGNAIDAIGQPDLLDRTMYLYRKDADPPEFLIEID
jgi:HKD family nuclease